MNHNFDVIVAGFGPCGAVMTKLLAREGLRVLAIDEAAEPYNKPRAIGTDHEAQRVLQFCEIMHELFPRTHTWAGSTWRSETGEVLREFVAAKPPYPLYWPPNVTYVQPELETMLRASVAREPGVHVRLSTKALRYEQDADSVRLTLRALPDGTEETVQARWLVACDGASSTIRQQMGAKLEDLDCDEWWVVVDTLVKDGFDFGLQNRQYCEPRRPGTYVRGPGRLRRFEFRVLPHESPDDYRQEARVLEMLGERIDTTQADIWRSAVYRFHALVADRWQDGRVFLAGDAAHQTPPHLGQGLVSGMRDAMNLAWKIAHVHAGANPALFDAYIDERRPHFRALAKTAKEHGEQIGEMDPVRAKERDARLLAALRARTTPEARQDYVPPMTGGWLDADANGAPRAPAGQLFIQPEVRTPDGGTRPLDDGALLRYQILTRDDDAAGWLDAERAARWAELGGERLALAASGAPAQATVPAGVTRYVEHENRFVPWLDAHGCSAVVVRPDRYVHGIARNAQELARLVDAIATKLHGQPGAARPLAFATQARNPLSQ
jgi:3-(3-hydroxy-phenyl)propionate hydroxylase